MSVGSALKRLIHNRHPLRLAWHRSKGIVAALRYGMPAVKLKVIGITGTDGKTTVTSMVAHILHSAGKSVGAASTTFFRVNSSIRWNETHMTSIRHEPFQRFLRECADAGCEYFVAEAASHGLVQGRLGPMRPAVAAITNTSLEHLDYHGTMEQYRKDKGLLFSMLGGHGTKVLNVRDDTFGSYVRIPSTRTIGYDGTGGVGPFAGCDSSLWLSDIVAEQNACTALVHDDSGNSVPLRLGVPGLFNLENALCAIGCAMAEGVALQTCISALASFGGVPGRLERINMGQPFSVFVDFTVTPLAYEKTLKAVRAMTQPGRRVMVLTGACGNRMREKRPVIGKLCSELADVVVVTTDETQTEDPQRIIDEVWSGVDTQRTQAHRITDRREAIAFLLRSAQPGDSVALCGMGACQTMQTQTGLIPWDEREIAREELRKAGYTK